VYDKIIVPGNNHDFTTHVISLEQLEFTEALQNHFYRFMQIACNDLKQKIRTIPDFSAPGILFRDITTLLADPEAFNNVIERFVEHFQSEQLESPNFHSCRF